MIEVQTVTFRGYDDAGRWAVKFSNRGGWWGASVSYSGWTREFPELCDGTLQPTLATVESLLSRYPQPEPKP